MLMPQDANGQYRFDYGFRAGVSNYLGEMGGKEEARKDFIWDMKLQSTRWVLGGFARYKINPLLSVNMGVSYLRIEGDDALSTNKGRRGRNLHFRNDMLESYIRTEVYFLDANDVGNRGRYQTDFKAYAFTGFAAIMHSPKAIHDGAWIKLRELQTEGIEYGKFTFGLPVGLGFFFTQKRKHRFGFEMSWTPTFTDYLDDASTVYADGLTGVAAAVANRYDDIDPSIITAGLVPNADQYAPGSKRGDPTHNDTYMYTAFTYSYLVRGYNNFYTQHYGWLGGRKRGVRKVRAKF
jgi:hypothetical protein